MRKTTQIFEITRAPEERPVDDGKLRKMLWGERPDSEWAVHEMVLEGRELVRKGVFEANASGDQTAVAGKVRRDVGN